MRASLDSDARAVGPPPDQALPALHIVPASTGLLPDGPAPKDWSTHDLDVGVAQVRPARVGYVADFRGTYAEPVTHVRALLRGIPIF